MGSPFVSSGGWPDRDGRVVSGSLLLYQAGTSWIIDMNLGHDNKRQTYPTESYGKVWRCGRGRIFSWAVVHPNTDKLSLNSFYGFCVFGCFRRVSIV